MGIVKACKAERQLFCKEVQAGQARVFRCLAENMNDVDFGNNCKYQIVNKLQRRWGLWVDRHSPSHPNTHNTPVLCHTHPALIQRRNPAAPPQLPCVLEPNLSFPSTEYPLSPPLPAHRQSNWKLDPPLRRACKEDVSRSCGDAASSNSEAGLVYKCLVRGEDAS